MAIEGKVAKILNARELIINRGSEAGTEGYAPVTFGIEELLPDARGAHTPIDRQIGNTDGGVALEPERLVLCREQRVPQPCEQRAGLQLDLVGRRVRVERADRTERVVELDPADGRIIDNP